MNNASSPACKSTFGNHPLLVIPFFRRWPRSIARDMVYTFIWNTGFALMFSVLGMMFDSRAGFFEMFWPNMMFAQCIGYLIHLGFALGGRVLLYLEDELVDQRGSDAGHRRIVGRTQQHGELVGDEDAVARDDDRFRVELPFQCAGNLDRLQAAPKGLGEGTVDRPLTTSFEVVQKAQESPR